MDQPLPEFDGLTAANLWSLLQIWKVKDTNWPVYHIQHRHKPGSFLFEQLPSTQRDYFTSLNCPALLKQNYIEIKTKPDGFNVYNLTDAGLAFIDSRRIVSLFPEICPNPAYYAMQAVCYALDFHIRGAYFSPIELPILRYFNCLDERLAGYGQSINEFYLGVNGHKLLQMAIREEVEKLFGDKETFDGLGCYRLADYYEHLLLHVPKELWPIIISWVSKHDCGIVPGMALDLLIKAMKDQDR